MRKMTWLAWLGAYGMGAGLVAVGVFVILQGQLAPRETEPTRVTVEQFLAERPWQAEDGPRWFEVSGCELNLTEFYLTYDEHDSGAEYGHELYVPLRPAGEDFEVRPRVLLRTDDAALVATARKLSSLLEDDEAYDAWVDDNAERVWREDVVARGMLVFLRSDGDRLALDHHQGATLILAAGREPHHESTLLSVAGAMIAGFGLVSLIVARWVVGGRGRGAAPAPALEVMCPHCAETRRVAPRRRAGERAACPMCAEDMSEAIAAIRAAAR